MLNIDFLKSGLSLKQYKFTVTPSIKDKQLYLCDSGGQYLGGTTDITRTIYLGKEKPNDQRNDKFKSC